MSSLSLRPGTSLGVYPQKLEPSKPTLERIGLECERWLGRLIRPNLYRLSYVVKRVNRAADGLSEVEDSTLLEIRNQLARELLKSGLNKTLVLKSFALIREVSERTLEMRHFDEQLFGAWVLIQGNLAEMATGEGKSLTATLAAATAGLAGIPVHVITTNEYLATRDAEEMGPLYQALGLTVAAITEQMSDEAKRVAYTCDVVYCTNKQVAFDYLRDRIIMGNETGRLSMKFNQHTQERAPVMRGLCYAIVDEADSVLIDDAQTPLLISREYEDADQKALYQQALALADEMHQDVHFQLLPREQRIQLTETGAEWLENQVEAFTGLWRGKKRREFLIVQALTALHLYQRDKHYLLKAEKVLIIDQNTGRVMTDHSWEQGLHQMIECKEGCSMSGQRETLARISYQRFFRRYLRLSGMSGTIREAAGEMRSVYQLDTIDVPLHSASRRRNLSDRIYQRSSDKWLAVVRKIKQCHEKDQPVLIGTRTVVDSHLLSRLLKAQNLPHQVLNAHQDKEEAQIIASAGCMGAITVATNMAGRGTDIKLDQQAAEKGGLHVISAERHDSRRVDRQLSGRSARQGDPGSCESILCLGDDLFVKYYPIWFRRILGAFVKKDKAIPTHMSNFLTGMAQRAIQKEYKAKRKILTNMDEKLGELLSFSGRNE